MFFSSTRSVVKRFTEDVVLIGDNANEFVYLKMTLIRLFQPSPYSKNILPPKLRDKLRQLYC